LASSLGQRKKHCFSKFQADPDVSSFSMWSSDDNTPRFSPRVVFTHLLAVPPHPLSSSVPTLYTAFCPHSLACCKSSTTSPIICKLFSDTSQHALRACATQSSPCLKQTSRAIARVRACHSKSQCLLKLALHPQPWPQLLGPPRSKLPLCQQPGLPPSRRPRLPPRCLLRCLSIDLHPVITLDPHLPFRRPSLPLRSQSHSWSSSPRPRPSSEPNLAVLHSLSPPVSVLFPILSILPREWDQLLVHPGQRILSLHLPNQLSLCTDLLPVLHLVKSRSV
jgi:hypothetical protein